MPQVTRWFISALLERNPTERIGAKDTSDVQKHLFYKDMDFDALMRREIPVPMARAAPTAPVEKHSATFFVESPFKDKKGVPEAMPAATGRTPPNFSNGLSGKVFGWEFSDAIRVCA